MGGCIMGKCFICGGLIDEDDWDCAFDDAEFFVMVHDSCMRTLPERIDRLNAKIEFLKAIKALRDAREE